MPEPSLSDLLPVTASAPTAHEHVREVLRKLILDGTLPAGAKLLQNELARLTRASTTPVREALRELAVEGLVTFDPHRGAVVRSIDPAEMKEIYQLRILLEPWAVGQAASRISPVQLQRADDIIATMSSVDDPAEWAMLNRDFHALIVDAAESARTSAIIKSLRDGAFLFVGTGARTDPTRMRAGDREHGAIVGALRVGDADLASTLTCRHLEGSLRASGLSSDSNTAKVGQ